ncbi:MAG: hypothetical protein A2X61_02665 [Ignavibacteria bacterium GWB2_35_12]|nr:MAG: hypothetical protein A2X63_11285 [Ignavibacteria bacterium GWA2_35_8]OGU42480.1 MAG: hypothetical protein A2X61_02665 [Ignavibacteria bacterium GWB2_35_12]OGU89884.1 MAG: hypothetical protein A2220_05825 [Ignavibacteria bacterium RIFOXYA2_FULL_35_10]OGV24260.1 MAG: hypothetical protein A2475_08590 [Ignavibacteria bacterium RIFOXYC2_FULL_35_21]
MENNFSLRVSILSSLPFLFLGLIDIDSFDYVKLPLYLSGLVFFVPVISMFVLFVVGWIKEFPRWTIPSVGFCIIFSLLLMNVSIPSITGGTILGVWALLPFAMALIISIVLKPSLKPLKKLAERIKDDTSLIVFSLYGILPISVLMVFDEVSDIKLIPILIIITLIITLGAFFYLYSSKKIIRTSSLILGIIFSLFISIISII